VTCRKEVPGLLNIVSRPEGGAAVESAADVAAAAGFAASERLAANGAARMPFGLGAGLPSVSTVARPRPVSGSASTRQLMLWAAARGMQQRHVAAQPLAAGPCGAPSQPLPSDKSIKQYPQTTRIAAGNSYAEGPHPARDPV
jgi:hypothetical protein